MDSLKLVDLVDVSVLQQIQDGFSKFTGMASITTDEHGVPITKGSGFCHFCMDMTRESAVGYKRCKKCDRGGALETLRTGRVSTYRCHAGLVDFAAPIMVEGHCVGGFIGGQVRPGDVDEAHLRQVAEELSLDPEEYIRAAKETRVMSMEQIESTAEFLAEIAKVLSEMAYQNYQDLQHSKVMEASAKLQTAYIMDRMNTMLKTMENWGSILDRSDSMDDMDKMKKTLRLLKSNSQEVISHIHEAIEYINMSSGNVNLAEEPYHVEDLAGQLREYIQKNVKNERLALRVIVYDSVPPELMGDVGRINKLLSRLIQNVALYVPEGDITLDFSCKKVSYAVWLVIQLRSKKQVISSEVLDRIRQLLMVDEKELEESGQGNVISIAVLGLVIRQMSGTIEAESTPEKGTRFTICLPQLEIDGQEPAKPFPHKGTKPRQAETEDAYIENQFGSALEKEEFMVYYQPKVNLRDYHMVGAEALCRWKHQGELIAPFKFIPVLERSKAICELDFYMLDHVCRDIRKWLDEGKKAVRVSVNLSRRHMGDPDLSDHILRIIDRYEVPHNYIEIELTETTTDVGFSELRKIVSTMQAQGIRTSVDDFGVGYSSLNLIRELPWDVLKIDKSFLPCAVDENDQKYIMFKHIIAMAQNIGLECIVEGVETIQQVRILKENNCYLAQGFYFDKPLQKEEFESRLTS